MVVSFLDSSVVNESIFWSKAVSLGDTLAPKKFTFTEVGIKNPAAKNIRATKI